MVQILYALGITIGLVLGFAAIIALILTYVLSNKKED
jgi:uncharacterized membrane protein